MIRALYSICAFCFLTVVMGTQCYKDDRYYELPKQNFVEKVTLSPALKIYNVGDTMWLNFTTQDKSLYDSISKQRLPSNLVKFLFGATLFYLHDTPQNPTSSLFDFVLPGGVSANITSTISGSTVYWYLGCDNTTSYNVRLGVIPKFQGIYLMEIPFSYIEACPNQINPYPRTSILFTFDVPDTNKDIYLTIPASKRIDPVFERQIDMKVAYAFKVQ
jgi:hypothetical protein